MITALSNSAHARITLSRIIPRVGWRIAPAKSLASALLTGMLLALNLSLAHADFVGPTTIPANGSFSGWTAPGAYSQTDGYNPNGLKAEDDIAKFWYAMSTASGASPANSGNLIQNSYFRVDTTSTSSTVNGQSYWVQLNMGTASPGMADHILGIYLDTGASPVVKIALYQYSTPYPAMKSFTTGKITAVVANYAITGAALDSNATGAWAASGSAYSLEVKIPISWYGSTYGGAIQANGTGANLIASAVFTATGSISAVGTVKDQLDDPTQGLYQGLVSATTGAAAFVPVHSGGGSYSATATANTLTPVAGAADSITLTINQTDGTTTDTSFTGLHNVILSGFSAAPDGSYGSFNGVTLTGSPQTISVSFVNGVASVPLILNKAATQTIGFSLPDLTYAAANNLTLTPTRAAASKLEFTTQPSPSTLTGVAFAQQPVVKIEDPFGNVATSGADATVNVALTLTTGTGVLSGTTAMNAVNGVADFTGKGLKINLAGTDKVLTATATLAAGTKTTTTSPAFTISMATAYRITDAANGTPTAGVADGLTIRLVDQFGNTVTSFSGDKNLTFSGLSTADDGTHPTVTSKSGSAVALGTAELITFTSGLATVGGSLVAYKAETQTLNVHDDAATPLSSTSPGGAGDSLTIANLAPVALNQTVTRGTNASLKILKSTLIAGASDGNHDTISFVSAQSPSGDAIVSTNATYVFYLPGTTQNGATFTYTTSDGHGGTSTKTVTVNVLRLAGAAQSISYTAGGVNLSFAGIVGYSYDVQRSTTADFASPTVIATLAVPTGGAFTYTDSSPLQPSGYYRLIQH